MASVSGSWRGTEERKETRVRMPFMRQFLRCDGDRGGKTDVGRELQFIALHSEMRKGTEEGKTGGGNEMSCRHRVQEIYFDDVEQP
jgi:hypothetical protein